MTTKLQPVVKQDVMVRPKAVVAPPWHVFLWDDPVNTRTYVVFVLRRVLGCSKAVATRLMLAAEQNGKAVVATEPREQAEMHVAQLHGFGLQATMAREE